MAHHRWRTMCLLFFLLLPIFTNLPIPPFLGHLSSHTAGTTKAPPLPYGAGNPVGYFNGSGGTTEIHASYNKTENTKTEKTDANDISIPVITEWQAFTDFYFQDITATSSIILDLETNDTPPIDGYLPFANAPYMSFQASNSCYLHSLQAYINRNWVNPGSDATIWVYNATSQAGKPKPDSQLYILPENVELGSAGISWINHTFSSPVLLDASKTYNNYFFITFQDAAPAMSSWGARNDTLSPPDNGYVWIGALANWLDNFDLLLNISLRPLGRYPAPSQVSMSVNSTTVVDAGGNTGQWNSTFTANSSNAFFDVTSSWPITFNYTYNATFSHIFSGVTTFRIDTQLSGAIWNITANIQFPSINANQNSRTINFTVPERWLVLGLNKSATSIPPTNYTWSGPSVNEGYVFIDEPHGAGNSTDWEVVAGDQNYLQSPVIWRGATDVTGQEVNITDTLSVTALLNVFGDGDGRFVPYDEAGVPLDEVILPPIGGVLTFPSFTPSSDYPTVENETVHCEVVWNNSFHAGVGVSSVDLVYPTRLTGAPATYTTLIGDNVTIIAYYNDTYNIAGIPSATVNLTFDFLTYYSLSDMGGGFYEREFDTLSLNLGRGGHLGTLQADRPGYSPTIGSITLTLWSKTQIVANWTSHTMNYTQSVVLEVNYSIVTPPGEGGLTGATVNISKAGYYRDFTEQGGGNYTVQLSGMDPGLGVGTHFLVVNASIPGYYQAQQLLVTLVVNGEPTQLTGEGTKTVVAGYGYNISVTYLTELGSPIPGASFTCLRNATPYNDFTWQEIGPGLYNLTFNFPADAALRYELNITASATGYEPSTHQCSVDVNLRPSAIEEVVVESGTVILLENSILVWVNYTDITGAPLLTGTMTSNWNSSYFFVELGNGAYRINCSTVGATAGSLNIFFTVQLTNYTPQTFSQTFQFYNPTTLNAVDGNQYQQYENEIVTIMVEYTDWLHSVGVDGARVNLTFVGQEHVFSSIGGGLYRLQLNVTGASPGSYLIDLDASTLYHQSQMIQVNLTVLAKLTVQFTPTLPVNATEGEPVQVGVLIALLNGTPVGGLQVRFTYILYLPDGSSTEHSVDTRFTNLIGEAWSTVAAPNVPLSIWEEYYPDELPYLRVRITFLGNGSIATNVMLSDPVEINMGPATYFNLYIRPMLLLGAMVAVVILLLGSTGYVVYRKRIRPKRIAAREKEELRGGAWAQRIMGLMELRALFVMHSASGLPIFTYSFTGEGLPSELLSGFITAVSAFHGELSGDPDRESQLRDIHYQDLHLSLHEGKHVMSVLILDSSPSDEVTESLGSFTHRFEEKHDADLEQFEGRIDIFNEANKLVEQSFHSELLIAYECMKTPSRGFPRRVYNLAKKLTTPDGRVYLPQLFIKAVEQFGPDKKFAVASAIEILHRDGCLVRHLSSEAENFKFFEP